MNGGSKQFATLSRSKNAVNIVMEKLPCKRLLIRYQWQKKKY